MLEARHSLQKFLREHLYLGLQSIILLRLPLHFLQRFLIDLQQHLVLLLQLGHLLLQLLLLRLARSVLFQFTFVLFDRVALQFLRCLGGVELRFQSVDLGDVHGVPLIEQQMVGAELAQAQNVPLDVLANSLHFIELCVELLELHFLAVAGDDVSEVLNFEVDLTQEALDPQVVEIDEGAESDLVLQCFVDLVPDSVIFVEFMRLVAFFEEILGFIAQEHGILFQILQKRTSLIDVLFVNGELALYVAVCRLEVFSIGNILTHVLLLVQVLVVVPGRVL